MFKYKTQFIAAVVIGCILLSSLSMAEDTKQESIIQTLIGMLSNDENPGVRSKAATQLKKIAKQIKDVTALEPAITPLLAALLDADMDVRDESTEALGNIASRIENKTLRKSAIDALIDTLSDDEAEVREEAAKALSNIASGIEDKTELEPAVEPLKKAQQDENEDVHKFAATALKNIGYGVQGKASTDRRQGPRRIGEAILYNGIELPEQWPPDNKITYKPMTVPYLDNPPDVIPIDVGRQLFVDDFLIERTNLTRSYHLPEYHQANPVLTWSKPWEMEGHGPYAAPFSDGVWYDPADKLFKMWYMAGLNANTCYAYSHDGINWIKPTLDVKTGTNIVLALKRDSGTVYLDLMETDPQRRYKMWLATTNDDDSELSLRCSPDGVHWSGPLARALTGGERTTVFYNPFRKKWVYSIRAELLDRRARRYREHADVTAPLQSNEIVEWVGADYLDPHNPNPKYNAIEPQLYNLDAAPYESLMLGFFSIYQGPPNRDCKELGLQKRNEVLIGYTRDGFHWHRPDRRPFLSANETAGAWNWGNVQSAASGCLVVGDNLYFYCSGHALAGDDFWDRHGSTGLGILRRDGFASLDARDQTGSLTTRPVTFRGKYLFVNVDCPQGELKAEVVDGDGKAITPFTFANCKVVSCDKTLAAVTWQGAADLSVLSGQPVRFRFHLRNGSLYAFWVSPDGSGASHGYVGAGGPVFTGPTDTIGMIED